MKSPKKIAASVLLIAGLLLLTISLYPYPTTEEAPEVLTDQVTRQVLEPEEETNYFQIITFIISTVLIASSFLTLYLEVYVEQRKFSLENLRGQEKSIYQYIKEKEPVYQSRIVKDLKVSKVKVSRVIKKLEYKQLIKKEKKGMTNQIKIKI